MLKKIVLPCCLALSLAACATAVPPVEVTRFHVGDPARSGTIAVEEMPGNPDVSLEYRTYSNAVQQELQKVGFTPTAEGAKSDYVALVAFRRGFRPTGYGRDGNPVSVGVGGGVGSGGYSGLGVGIGIDLSGKPKDIVSTELQVQIRRRSDSTTVWEGRAITQAREGSPAAQPGLAAGKLATALIQGYPGESGRTITVK
ncbi:hypothetical protein FHS51_000755 [Sphingobium wenxiniae]|jgi:hypothetical protein|uniref:DUF4136 domain-containing protein n=2 Tax=Sphingobium TaxID=165695 RepID=T0G070_9SPHN|nr:MULTISPECIES: hypothetical protein [Sphingobium]EQA97050.1 hypothetical protein L485_23540 [Sphingobium baderi LL03]KMS64163.1 hypothetical protein V475_17010 [Sphingobium baderi LL03]MBB6190542.1 hypothetical protein [Sphingobium wenxiniae]TWH95256.1 hypothetical protein IQ35_01512 [Sphingobium wenxiniae]WRD78075.1 hypothetical protein QQ987_08305 [Sphingobium baderi]